MKRKSTSKHPPVQGVQISSRISSIRLIALDSTLTQAQRLEQMQYFRDDAIAKLNAYYDHWVQQTKLIA